MLIDKGFTQGDIVSIKFIGGEEIVARYEAEDSEHIKIMKPLAITLGPQGLGMIPWIFLADTEEIVKVRWNSVAAIVKPKKDAADQYLQGTTGLALAK